MVKSKFYRVYFYAALVMFGIGLAIVAGYADKISPELDVPYEPTHPSVVKAMLRLAGVGKGDVVYDLGCGDGRFVVTAVAEFGAARAVGIDLNPQRIKEATERAQGAGVLDKIRYVQGNIMEVDASPATVVTMYLLDSVNLMVRPKLFQELSPGTRCVSHAFHMHDWKQDKIIQHPKARNNRISFWVIPAHLGGKWNWSTTTPAGKIENSLVLTQTFQVVEGTILTDGRPSGAIQNSYVSGKEFSFTANIIAKGQPVRINYKGIVEDKTIRGTQEWSNGQKYVWIAKYDSSIPEGKWEFTVAGPVNLSGKLTLQLHGRKIHATYFVKNEGREERLRDVYLWGSSIYFRLPMYGRERLAVFKGSLEGNTGNGKMAVITYSEEGPFDFNYAYGWTATKTQ
ncbi:MAG: class I SAM-dependent methyltransferase [Spirochaetes bacterium]|nr:class I SAM-dependent methyltransferase [Spirochaetota bacterium]